MGVDEDHFQSGADHPPRGTTSENESCQKTRTDVQEKSPVRSSETSMTSDSSPSPGPVNKSKVKSTTIAFSVERILGCDKLSNDSKPARSRHEDRAADFLPYHRPSDVVDFRPSLGAFQSSSFHPVIPDLYNYVCPWTNVHRDRYGAVVRRVGHPYQNRTPPKRKKPRTAFTRHQVLELEKRFARQKYLASAERSSLAKTLNMTDAQVKTWFQNRRTKWRRETAEEREIERQAAQKFLLSLRGDEPRHQTMYHPLCVPAPSTPLPLSPRETLDPGVK